MIGCDLGSACVRAEVLLAIIARDQRAHGPEDGSGPPYGVSCTVRQARHHAARIHRIPEERNADSLQRLVVVTEPPAPGQAVVTEFLATGALPSSPSTSWVSASTRWARPTMCTLSAPNSPTPPRPPRRGRPSTRSAPPTPGHPGRRFPAKFMADLTGGHLERDDRPNVASGGVVGPRGRRPLRGPRAADRSSPSAPRPRSPAPLLAHATSKAAVVRITELLAEELRPAKIARQHGARR